MCVRGGEREVSNREGGWEGGREGGRERNIGFKGGSGRLYKVNDHTLTEVCI